MCLTQRSEKFSTWDQFTAFKEKEKIPKQGQKKK